MDESNSHNSIYDTAIFAGGCFWCMVKPFDQWPGIIHVVSGYTGGSTMNPTYEEVCSGSTGHVEAVQITFDPSVISYNRLLEVFWQQIDPTDEGGQFCDRGSSYRTAIFWRSEVQRKTAEKSKAELDASGRFERPVVTPLLAAKPFYPAEDYHQDFYKRNPHHYAAYRRSSGRDDFLERHWQK